jgi:hypothetical protein
MPIGRTDEVEALLGLADSKLEAMEFCRPLALGGRFVTPTAWVGGSGPGFLASTGNGSAGTATAGGGCVGPGPFRLNPQVSRARRASEVKDPTSSWTGCSPWAEPFSFWVRTLSQRQESLEDWTSWFLHPGCRKRRP